MDETVISCSNPECQSGETGQCVEGLAMHECPHLLATQEEAETVGNNGEPYFQDAVDKSELLPSGEQLGVSEAVSILCAGPGRVIAPVGPTESGKTTLIAAFYEMFQKGPFGGFHFAGSHTLVAFERTVHRAARAASGQRSPATERTPFGTPLGFYHMRLGDNRGKWELLFSDRAGEDYLSLVDNPSESTGFSELQRADFIVLLVNGERLLDARRHNTVHQAKMLLQGMNDAGCLSPGQEVQVVLTKWDLVVGHVDRHQVEERFDALVQDMAGHCPVPLAPFKIAALPQTDELPMGYELSSLLETWVRGPRRCDGSHMGATQPRPDRAFVRFGQRRGSR